MSDYFLFSLFTFHFSRVERKNLMIEWLTTIGAIFNPIGFALTALALYYAISTARKVSSVPLLDLLMK